MKESLSPALMAILKQVIWKKGIVKADWMCRYVQEQFPRISINNLRALRLYWEKFVGKTVPSTYTNRPLLKHKSFSIRRNIRRN